MKPKWLIEDFDNRNSFALLAAEVIQQGMECEIVKYTPLQSGNYNVGCKETIFLGKPNDLANIIRTMRQL